MKLIYRKLKGYEYDLQEEYRQPLTRLHRFTFDSQYLALALGVLIIKKGYAWDGPSGPTFDTKNFMRGSLVHDALYQLMREGVISRITYREYADDILKRLCLEDGMSKFRAWYVYKTVRVFGKFTCKPRKNHRGRIVVI